jgi:hypothetical protein
LTTFISPVPLFDSNARGGSGNGVGITVGAALGVGVSVGAALSVGVEVLGEGVGAGPAQAARSNDSGKSAINR